MDSEPELVKRHFGRPQRSASSSETTSESSVAAGVRRIEAKTGLEILNLLRDTNNLLHQASAKLKLSNPNDLVAKCGSMMEELKERNREIDALNAKIANARFGNLLDQARDVKGVKVVSSMISDAKVETLRQIGDQLRDKEPSVVAVLIAAGERSQILCICGKEAVKKGAHAGKIVREVAAITGGKGGGRPDSAMAGVGDNTKCDEALLALPSILEKLL